MLLTRTKVQYERARFPKTMFLQSTTTTVGRIQETDASHEGDFRRSC